MLTKLFTNCNTMLFLFGGQEPGHELCSNAVRVKITRENCLHCSVWHIDDCSNVLNVSRRSSCISCRIVSTFWGFDLVEVRPDLSPSSDVLPLLKHACYSKHVARLVASLPYARRNISKVSAPDLPSLTENLMLARCSSFTSMLKWQMWRHMWWQTLVLCNSQYSNSEATWHTEWRGCQLSIIANNFHVVPSVGGLCEIVWELFDTPTYVAHSS
jgi:hypothetical protein